MVTERWSNNEQDLKGSNERRKQMLELTREGDLFNPGHAPSDSLRIRINALYPNNPLFSRFLYYMYRSKCLKLHFIHHQGFDYAVPVGPSSPPRTLSLRAFLGHCSSPTGRQYCRLRYTPLRIYPHANGKPAGSLLAQE